MLACLQYYFGFATLLQWIQLLFLQDKVQRVELRTLREGCLASGTQILALPNIISWPPFNSLILAWPGLQPYHRARLLDNQHLQNYYTECKTLMLF